MRLYDTLNDLEMINDIGDNCTLLTEFVTSLCGEKLGSGMTRLVYEYRPDPSYVVKIEPGVDRHNILEHELWCFMHAQALEGDKHAVLCREFLAPIRWISDNGRLLVMKRTMDRPSRKPPKRVPWWFTDLKPENFGWIGKKFVCHDYALQFRMWEYSGTRKLKFVDE